MVPGRWLYSQLLTIDANFRLKNKERGIRNDPPLGDGWGHWVPSEQYEKYIREFGHQQEVSWTDLENTDILLIVLSRIFVIWIFMPLITPIRGSPPGITLQVWVVYSVHAIPLCAKMVWAIFKREKG